MVTIENQRGEPVNVIISTMILDPKICGVTTTDDQTNYLITINEYYLTGKNSGRGRIALIHELLHVYNWKAGHNKRRHRTCHFLAVALHYGASCSVLKIRSPRAVNYIQTILEIARKWWERYIKRNDSTSNVQ